MESLKIRVPGCVTKNGKFSKCSLFRTHMAMESTANDITLKRNLFATQRICKNAFLRVEPSWKPMVSDLKSAIFQKMSRFFGAWGQNEGEKYPQSSGKVKRHRIWAFQIHPGRSWKFEQKILSELGEILKIAPGFFSAEKNPGRDTARNSYFKGGV